MKDQVLSVSSGKFFSGTFVVGFAVCVVLAPSIYTQRPTDH